MTIINAHICTMEGPDIGNGYLSIRDGKILDIGPMEYFMDDGAEKLDACGGWLLPGLIDIHTHLGMWEDSLGFEGDDGNEDTDPCTPHLRALDAVNPMDRSFEEARRAGVTTVLSGPGSANPIGGQFLAMKTMGRRVDDMVLRAPAAMKFALGENPKGAYHEKNQMPSTRMATAAIIRENLFKAREYLRLKENAERDDECDEPDFDMKLESLIPLIRGEIQAHFHAHRADDIFTAIRIAKEFELDYVLVHATEGHLIAEELAKEEARVIAGPSLGFRSKPELRNLSFETPGVLSKKGILTAITTDHPETPLSYLMLCARLACESGMAEQDALRAVTLSPAQIVGLDGRIGSLKAGKDADLVLYTQHPFERDSMVRFVWIDGRRIEGASAEK